MVAELTRLLLCLFHFRFVSQEPLPATLEAACQPRGLSDQYSIASSKQRAQQLAAARAGNPSQPMNDDLYAAILLYTGNSIYADLNRTLRSESRAATVKWFSYLRLLLEAMNKMTHTGVRTLYRGISVDLYDQYAEGSDVVWWSVSSCTAERSVAENFMRVRGGRTDRRTDRQTESYAEPDV